MHYYSCAHLCPDQTFIHEKNKNFHNRRINIINNDCAATILSTSYMRCWIITITTFFPTIYETTRMLTQQNLKMEKVDVFVSVEWLGDRQFSANVHHKVNDALTGALCQPASNEHIQCPSPCIQIFLKLISLPYVRCACVPCSLNYFSSRKF